MNVEVKLFAIARQRVGAEQVVVAVESPATVRRLRAALAEQFPALAGDLRHMHIAIDAEYATDETPIREAAEVALIPPVSGG